MNIGFYGSKAIHHLGEGATSPTDHPVPHGAELQILAIAELWTALRLAPHAT